MFEKGEYVVYGSKGVYKVEDITHVDISGADKERLYYILTPMEEKTGKIYAPTDHTKVTIRKVISREEAAKLIEDMPSIEQLWVPEERMREMRYKEAMRTCDYYAWVSIIKALYFRQQERVSQGKKITALDEKYLKAVENELYSELSLCLGVPKENMADYITSKLEQK